MHVVVYLSILQGLNLLKSPKKCYESGSGGPFSNFMLILVWVKIVFNLVKSSNSPVQI